MYPAFIISVILVTIIGSLLTTYLRKKEVALSIGLFPYRFKFVGVVIIIFSIVLNFLAQNEIEDLNNIRIFIANLGLIVILLSKDKVESNIINSFKMTFFSLSAILYYLANHLMFIFAGSEKKIDLSHYVLYLLVAYIITYYFIRAKLLKGGRED